ncbi:MAG TPA: RagB/SusD family nutrient uptake outer membrane protein, partial [Pedobacter sp.]|nr:RagB/SusD family nutrient uptake outer membrane protein [Pedobacter sp.]
RYKTGTYLPYTIGNTINVLALILAERRKELICRGTRWMDLKRLNLEPANATTLTRNVNGLTYTLLPNSKRYALPIPDEEILISGLPQNIR